MIHFRPATIAGVAAVLAGAGTGVSVQGAEPGHGDEHGITIKPMLEKYCYGCHGPEKVKGDLNFAEHADYAQILKEPELWEKVSERLFAFEMPPEGKPAPEGRQREQLLDWLRRLPKPEVDCSKLASDRTQSFYQGHVMSRRLTRGEYDRSIRDLIGMEFGLEEMLPADGAGGEGFDATGDTLFTSPLTMEKYLAAAEKVTRAVLADDDGALSPEVLEARVHLLGAMPSDSLPPREAARLVLERLLRRAFRRPVAPDEVTPYVALFERRHSRGDGYVASLRLAVRAVLVSPHFLFLIEPEPPEGGTQPLGPFPLASRLSYFIWSSMPDDELFRLAESGELVKDDVLAAQVRRMLQDPRSDSLGERFAVQWLDLDTLGGDVRPDPQRFPEFDDALGAAMRGEVVAFFNHLIRENKPLTDLIDADYTYLNERLAAHYGLPGGQGEAFERVQLPSRERGGLLGMAAIHAVTSFPLRTSPVLRGRWVLDAVLGDKVPPPPPNVPALRDDGPAATAISLRQQLEEHRRNPDCSGCHSKMDPIGFGLEGFDVLGRLRSDGVDANGTLPTGESFNGPAELKNVLMGRRDAILRNIVRRLSGYALGRALNRFDTCVIDGAMKALDRDGARPQEAIVAIVLSKPFRHRFYPKGESSTATTGSAGTH